MYEITKNILKALGTAIDDMEGKAVHIKKVEDAIKVRDEDVIKLGIALIEKDEMVERLVATIKGQSCETCNAHGYRLKYRRLVDCIKRNIDDTTRGLLGDVLRQHNTNEANRGKK